MILTEQEAKEKWCPFVRAYNGVTAVNTEYTVNTSKNSTHDARNPALCRCIASACMAWRISLDSKGFCGLAGKPKI